LDQEEYELISHRYNDLVVRGV